MIAACARCSFRIRSRVQPEVLVSQQEERHRPAGGIRCHGNSSSSRQAITACWTRAIFRAANRCTRADATAPQARCESVDGRPPSPPTPVAVYADALCPLSLDACSAAVTCSSPSFY
ncbi:hypothetical protein HPB50_012384 [Hyalomma asiaticum]|uniref:Uncharacterized protein n=1 Tax=Hyalomma asiaticum TaxID=266040 RepID=A0ACB7SPQ3_HYAAI|nr:hypothetical protein HPB50_012384 [Hyalomma asiaticum]